jgi:type I restriction enzyme R subunit
MTSNFAFLKEKFEPLAHLGELAESYLYSDPNSCLIKIGMMGEMIVNYIYHYDFIKPPVDNNLVNRINVLLEEDYVTDDIASALHTLRKARNKAAHDNYNSTEECKRLLPMIFSICQWFLMIYDYRYKPSGSFIMPEELRKEEKTIETAAEKENDEELVAHPAAHSSMKVEKLKPEERKKKIREASGRRDITEEETRCIIDEQLRSVGWEADTVNLRYSRGARPEKGHNQAIAEWPTERGPVDYALFIGLDLVGIIEAKRMNTEISSVLDGQARDYAKKVVEDVEPYGGPKAWGDYQVPFEFAANGRPYIEQYKEKSGIWFLDLRDPANVPQALHGWFSPEGLKAKLEVKKEEVGKKLEETPYDELKDPDGLNLRDYQIEAIKAAEKAISSGKKSVLLAMATGTGKTRTVLGLIYRFLKTKRFRRVLFLVDRNILGEQAMNTFKGVRLDRLQSLNEIYNIQSLDDAADLEKETSLQIATVQSMVRRILYHEGDRMPAITDFDLVIIDEAHRGYILDKEMTEEESLYRSDKDYVSKYRSVVEYFDAVKIALTATPALHTTQIFGKPVYTYSYRDAVIDGYLVDHNPPVRIYTELGKEGIHYVKGDEVTVYDPNTFTGMSSYEIPDDMDFDVEKFNRKIMVEGFNQAILRYVADHIDPTDRDDGKTLIYAVNDNHADMIVRILKEYFSQQGVPGEAVMKITGSIENGNQKKIHQMVKRFRLEQYPSIVVTVDLLTTGVDIPSITNLVFLRRVKSRILFEQMLGRATRLCPEIHKEAFNIYDGVGTYDSFEDVNTMKPAVANPNETMSTLVEGLKSGTQTETAISAKVLSIAAKLRRKQKNVTKEAEEDFAADTGTKGIGDFIHLILNLPPKEAERKIIASEMALENLEKTKGFVSHVYVDNREDRVTEVTEVYGGKGNKDPGDYLKEFGQWITNNRNEVAAISIVLTSPKDLTRDQLINLRKVLGRNHFTENELNQAISNTTKREAAADIISLIRRAALGSALVSREERIDRAVSRIKEDLKKKNLLTKQQENFLDTLRIYFINDDNYIVNKDMFLDKRWEKKGTYTRFNKVFKNDLDDVLDKLNEYLYDEPDGGTTA